MKNDDESCPPQKKTILHPRLITTFLESKRQHAGGCIFIQVKVYSISLGILAVFFGCPL